MTLISLTTGVVPRDLRGGITIKTNAKFSSSQPPKTIKKTRIQDPGNGSNQKWNEALTV
ncbi:hypothetical protein [Bradyrhizobium canariense]|uniref:hypothetical protein n=1 Tax=Bradyrhizobium canariense TaxID=255045 RepID=UPI001CA4E383|nr:hypothetical protein [Bradyrhizobium canariense]